MSQFIKDICNRIYEHPELWTPLAGNAIYRGMTDGTIRITYAGLSQMGFESIVDVAIGDNKLSFQRWDRYRIEKAVRWYWKQCSLTTMLTVQPF